MAQCVLGLRLMQGISWLTQPWGGAMALGRSTFEALGVAELWGRTVVDDVTLAARLQRAGIRCVPAPRASLESPLAGVGFGPWRDWLTRQLQYLKHCMPGVWLAAAPGALLLALPAWIAPALVLGWAVGLVGFALGLGSLVYLAALIALEEAFRRLVPGRVPVLAWAWAFSLTLAMALHCYLRTWTTNVMRWRGIAYRVGSGGAVREILHPEARPCASSCDRY